MLGVGAIIGTGIFVLTGQAAAANAGPAIVISMVLAGVTSVLAALCYSEFASTVPVAGSAYTYAYATLGEFVAWVIGWDLILEYALGAATVAVGWSGNLVTLLHQLGIEFPAALSAAPGTVVQVAGGDPVTAVFNLPAVLITVAVTAPADRRRQRVGHGQRRHRRHQGRRRADRDRRGRALHRRANWHPFIPPNTGTFGEYGWSGILRGAGVIFFAYIGFDAVSTSAQEARNPQRDMPRGILGSLAICTVLFVLVSGVMVGLVPYKTMLNQPAPLVLAIQAAAGEPAGTPWAPTDERAEGARDRRRAGRAQLGDGGDDARAAADLPGDVEGRPAAGVGGTRPPALPHAAHLDDRDRRRRRARRGPDADRHARDPRQHRHADGVRDRLDRRSSCCAGRGPICRDRSACRGCRCCRCCRRWSPDADARPAARDVGAADHLDGRWDRVLLRLRLPAAVELRGLRPIAAYADSAISVTIELCLPCVLQRRPGQVAVEAKVPG